MTLAETLARLHAASFPRGWSAAEFEALLANPTTCVVTSEHGFALLQVIPPEAELITISILPARRGAGHGGALLGQALLAAEKAGATEVFLEVEAENTAARALYDRAGFSVTGLREAYYHYPDRPPSDAVTMRLSLAAQSGGI